MAALYLHNALFTPAKHSPPPVFHHASASHDIRHQRDSSISTATLQTTSSRNSHPTKPLLHPDSEMGSPSREHSHLDPRQDTSLDLAEDRSSKIDRKGYWGATVRKRLARLRLWKRMLLASICIWALYNTIRYFISSHKYISQERQLFALFLGTSTILSLALVTASLLVNLLTQTMLDHTESRSIYIIKQIILPYAASWFLLTPSIVNFVLVFVWKNSFDPESTLRGRCYWDIDVVWSGIGMRCTSPGTSPSWASWLLGAIFRLLLTFGFLAAYHAICHKYEAFRSSYARPEENSYTRFPAHRHHHHRDSSITHVSARGLSPDRTATTSTIVAPPTIHRHHYHRDLSAIDDDIEDGSRASHTFHRRDNGNRLQQDPSCYMTSVRLNNDSTRPAISSELASCSGGLSTSSDETVAVPESRTINTRVPPGLPFSVTAGSNDADLNIFANHFRDLVDQISRETEDGIDIATPNRHADSRRYIQSSGTYKDEDEVDGDGDEDEFNPYVEYQSQPFNNNKGQAWYYDEFGQLVLLDLQPDCDRVEVFGRLVHRMPTIESIGSRERHSLATISTKQMDFETPNPSAVPTRSSTMSEYSSAGSPVSWKGQRRSSWDAQKPTPVLAGGTILTNEPGDLVAQPAVPVLPNQYSPGEYSSASSSQTATTYT